jgi:glutaminyl-tRNA synthetase
MKEAIKQPAQVTAGVKYLSTMQRGAPLNRAALETEIGAGQEVSEAQMSSAVKDLLAAPGNAGLPAGPLLAKLRARPALKWADGAKLKATLDAALAAAPPAAAPAAKQAPAAVAKPAAPAPEDGVTLSSSVRFPAPTENRQKTPELLVKHLEATGGRVVTRFPPEPNGFLHLGHSKAMNLSYGYAKRHKGWCYMRFDDTNPEKEKQVYIDSILDTVRWLGHEWHAVTYASDYFPRLYECACELIRRGLAYVDHSTAPEMADQREKRVNSPWRDRPVEESLRLFRQMKEGRFAEGAATLRLRMDMKSDNPVMRDLVAYRIK